MQATINTMYVVCSRVVSTLLQRLKSTQPSAGCSTGWVRPPTSFRPEYRSGMPGTRPPRSVSTQAVYGSIRREEGGADLCWLLGCQHYCVKTQLPSSCCRQDNALDTSHPPLQPPPLFRFGYPFVQIKPLDEDKAIADGGDLLAEGFIYALGAFLSKCQ